MSKKLLLALTVYFMFGIVFAFAFAIYYKWSPLSYLSPGFYAVAITWPYQAFGFINDLSYYGLSGKPI